MKETSLKIKILFAINALKADVLHNTGDFVLLNYQHSLQKNDNIYPFT